MQTFLPFADFARTAAVLDSPRLGKQRVETLQILRALELPEYGWQNHPAVTMWRGRRPALVCYGLTCVREWRARGFADSTAEQIAEFAPEAAQATQADLAARGLMPRWLEDERVQLSHRSRLLAKDPAFYAVSFPGTPADLDYFWPGPDPLAPAVENRVGDPLWVLRAENVGALGEFLDSGVVGFGAGCGIDSDVSGLDLGAMRDLLGVPGRRRPNRQLLALAQLLTDVSGGDEVATPVAGGSALLVGRITGDYHFQGRSPAGIAHRRPVSWNRLVPRSAVAPAYALQDVRPLFRVRLALPIHTREVVTLGSTPDAKSSCRTRQ